jgi:NAD(P)H-dependent flavin oxidoreductase YrpB (nitropropane dioxygenase family)
MAGGPLGETSFTKLVRCRLPVQEAVLGGDVGGARLAAAVCRAGALGMLSESGVQPLNERMDWLDQHCQQPYGIGILGFSGTIRQTLELVAGRARVVDVFWAEPDPVLVAAIKDTRALCIWQVGSLDEARAAADAGCDAVVAQGMEAGGHVRGTTPLLELLDEVVPAVEIPVVAAGGIADGRAAARAFEHGAAAVRVGTRLLATQESNAHPDYVAALLAAGGDATVVTTAFGADWPDAPHRVLRTAVAAAEATSEDRVGSSGRGRGAWPIARWSAMPPTRATTGDVAAMALYAGEGVGAIADVPPAVVVIDRLMTEARQALASSGGSGGAGGAGRARTAWRVVGPG